MRPQKRKVRLVWKESLQHKQAQDESGVAIDRNSHKKSLVYALQPLKRYIHSVDVFFLFEQHA